MSYSLMQSVRETETCVGGLGQEERSKKMDFSLMQNVREEQKYVQEAEDKGKGGGRWILV